MRREIKYRYLLMLSLLFIVGTLSAYAQQKYPERSFIRGGNREYEAQRYSQSESEYRKALDKTPSSYEASYNLASSLYKQERYEEAAKMFSQLAQNPDTQESAQNHYNTGNSLFQAGKLEEALEEYKNSLRKNPDDLQAKYNLAYTKKMLEQQEDEKKDDEDKEDKEDNQDNEDKEDKENQNDDKSDDPKDDNQDNDPKDGEDSPPGKSDPQKSSMSKEEAERLLEAMQMNEDKTREKMNEEKAVGVAPSGKNW